MSETSFIKKSALGIRCLIVSLLHRGAVLGLLGCLAIACSASVLGQWRRPRASAKPPAVMPPSTNKEQTATPAQDFDTLATQASAAREGDRIDEAITLYTKALSLRPQWAEGWWYLATLYYDHDNYKEAAEAFKQTAQIHQRFKLRGSEERRLDHCSGSCVTANWNDAEASGYQLPRS